MRRSRRRRRGRRRRRKRRGIIEGRSTRGRKGGSVKGHSTGVRRDTRRHLLLERLLLHPQRRHEVQLTLSDGQRIVVHPHHLLHEDVLLVNQSLLMLQQVACPDAFLLRSASPRRRRQRR